MIENLNMKDSNLWFQQQQQQNQMEKQQSNTKLILNPISDKMLANRVII
jgi:hypothetical protein